MAVTPPNALDNLRAIERIDTRLILMECIDTSELSKRRVETGTLIDKVEHMLEEKVAT